MSIISRLRGLFEPLLSGDETTPDQGVRLTVAALLVLVARADGRVLQVEETGLHMLLRSRFGLSAEQVEAVIGQVDIWAEPDPAATLAERILQDVGPDERPAIMTLAYRMAAVDGFVHEFEDDLLWRIGRLLGFTDPEITTLRDGALQAQTPERARVR